MSRLSGTLGEALATGMFQLSALLANDLQISGTLPSQHSFYHIVSDSNVSCEHITDAAECSLAVASLGLSDSCMDQIMSNGAPYKDAYEYSCEIFRTKNWCSGYGEFRPRYGLTPNEACCTCGGGAGYSRAVATCVDQTMASGSTWQDSTAAACQSYEANAWCAAYGNGYANGGFTANQACCACGGGIPNMSVAAEPPGCVFNSIISKTFVNPKNKTGDCTLADLCICRGTSTPRLSPGFLIVCMPIRFQFWQYRYIIFLVYKLNSDLSLEELSDW